MPYVRKNLQIINKTDNTQDKNKQRTQKIHRSDTILIDIKNVNLTNTQRIQILKNAIFHYKVDKDLKFLLFCVGEINCKNKTSALPPVSGLCSQACPREGNRIVNHTR